MGWLCSYTPLELIYAAEFIPYRIAGHSEPVRKSDSYTHANMCQFVRSSIDIAVEGGYDHLEGAAFINSCDAMRRLHDVWKRFISSKFLLMIDLPMGNSSLNPKYLKSEFQKLKKGLEDFSNKQIEDERIEEAIDVFTESRNLYHKLNSLRMEKPPKISGKELMSLVYEFFQSDPKLWNEKVTSILEKGSKYKLENNIPRIILSGSPVHDAEFLGFIEDCGLNVVYEDVCTGSKFFDINVEKSEDLLDSLSRAYLNRTPCARMMTIEERAKHLIQMSEKFDVDGIIHHSLKFCDVYLYDVPKLKEIINEAGLSVLFIESDGRLGSLNQLKTRIEAFSEMISK